MVALILLLWQRIISVLPVGAPEARSVKTPVHCLHLVIASSAGGDESAADNDSNDNDDGKDEESDNQNGDKDRSESDYLPHDGKESGRCRLWPRFIKIFLV